MVYMIYFKYVFEVRGGHTHVALFVGSNPLSLAKSGDLCFTNEEWHVFRAMIDADIEVVEK